MKEKPEFELLIEIAKLLKKYSPELSETLAEHLISPEFIERLVSVLSPTVKIPQIAVTQEIKSAGGNQRRRNSRTSLTKTKASRTTRRKDKQSAARNQRPRSSRPSLLIELEKTEPDKSALLVKFHDGLMDKTFLPTLADIRTFALDKDLPPIKATSRNKAILPLVKSLSPLTVDELKKKLDAVMPVSTQDDRSLEGWANIILDKEQRTKLGD